MSKQDTVSKFARRQYTAQFKDELVQRCLQPGASVSGIALENGINANVLFRWRREHLRANGLAMEPAAGTVLLPVKMAVTPIAEAVPAALPATAGVIEIDIAGAQVRLNGAVDAASVRCVLQTLRELA
jgi:transposase